MKKLWLNIRLFLASLAWGMRGADKLIASSNKEADGGDISGIEQKQEAQNVYADLLRGEVTQEVKELRHEMYYSERKSHEYEYGGGGHAIKRNRVFDCAGNVENSDGLKIQLIQEDQSSLIEQGIFSRGTEVELSEKAMGDLKEKDKRDFTIKITRDFLPSFRLEQYASKIVVKKVDDRHAILDIYTWANKRQFDNRHKLFISALEKIYMGDKRSDIVDFSELEFYTYNAYGSDDMMQYSYGNIHFENILLFDGSYILRFSADILKDGYDLISEFYDETAAKKSENREARKNVAAINMADAIVEMNDDNYDFEQAESLIKDIKDGE